MERKTIENDLEYLRQISKEVDFKNDNWQEAIKSIDEYCNNEENCMAMASVQIGIPLRLIYLKKTNLATLEEDYNERKIMINPRIIKSEGLVTYWEACASCLDYTGLMERPYKITLEYYDEFENFHCEEIEGFPCVVISHEIDHLDGILHLDFARKLYYLNKDERVKLREKQPYEIIRKTGAYVHPPVRKDNFNFEKLKK